MDTTTDTETARWDCQGCGIHFPAMSTEDTCPTCGAKVDPHLGYAIPSPQPGDVVLYADGSRGVIDGPYFGTDFEDGRGPVALTVKGASAFRGGSHANDPDEYVSCSGGPCPFVPLGTLEYAGTMTQRFWRWKDRPRAGGGEEYTLEVAAWRTPVVPR